MRILRSVVAGCMLCALFSSAVTAQSSVQDLFKSLQGVTGTPTGDTSESQIVKGLKEALRVGTGKAVSSTGKKNGYYGNALIKILMPEKLRTVEKGLRFAGYGQKVDEFVLSMNRAAEKAAPQAKRIFIDAITSMSFADARGILAGGDTAATDFFRTKTSDDLYQAFRPIVDDTLNQVGTVRKYDALVGQAKALPFVKSEHLDVGNYVTDQALAGLFTMVAKEEKNIRQNPAARMTPLLQQVFGR